MASNQNGSAVCKFSTFLSITRYKIKIRHAYKHLNYHIHCVHTRSDSLAKVYKSPPKLWLLSASPLPKQNKTKARLQPERALWYACNSSYSHKCPSKSADNACGYLCSLVVLLAAIVLLKLNPRWVNLVDAIDIVLVLGLSSRVDDFFCRLAHIPIDPEATITHQRWKKFTIVMRNQFLN